MTPKEKCVELIEKYSIRARVAECSGSLISMGIIQKRSAIQCAIICVEEIQKALTEYGRESDELQNMDRDFAWWDKVLQHLKSTK